MDLNQLNANISLNIQNFVRGMGQVAQAVRVTATDMQRSFGGGVQRDINNTTQSVNQLNSGFKDMDRIVGGILISQMFYQGTQAIIGATAAMTDFMSNMEKAQISMEYFLGGDPEAAKGFIMNMQDFSAETAFATNQSINLSKKLLNAGFQATQVRSIMERLNDATAVAGMSPEVMDRIVLAMTQMKTNGKIMGTEMRQLAEANIPVYKILQEQLGLTGEQIMNIGDMKIDSDIGIAAIFEGLKKYEGAADRLADTLPGMWETIKDSALIIGEQLFAKPYAALKGFIGRWRDGMDMLRDTVTESGIGGVFEKLIPPELHTSIRLIIGSFGSLIKSAGMMYQAFLPVIKLVTSTFAVALGTVMPYIAWFANALAQATKYALQSIPAIKFLAVAIGTLMIANTAAKTLMLLWSVMRLGVIASAVGTAVMWLANSIKYLTVAMAKNPVLALVMVIAGAILYLALSSATATKWLDALMQRLGALGGFNVGEVMQPKDNKSFEEWTDKFNESLDGMADTVGDFKEGMKDGLGDTGKGADKAKKKIEKFVASFDELYQIPEKLDEVGDGLGGIGEGLDPGAGFPDMSMPDMGFEMPGLPKMPEMEEIKIPEIIFPGGGGKPGGAWGDWFNLPDMPDLAPVTGLIITVEGLIADMRARLRGGAVAVGGWIAETAGAFGDWVADTAKSFGGWVTETAGAFGGWTVETGNALRDWTTGTANDIGAWAIGVAATITTWSIGASRDIQNWATQTATNISTWRVTTTAALTSWSGTTAATIAAWILSTSTNISKWATTTTTNIVTWAANTSLNLATWSTVTKATIAVWVTTTAANIAAWGTNTGANIALWARASISNISSWAVTTAASIASWINGTAGGFASWTTNVLKNLGAFANGGAGAIASWASSSWSNFNSWLSGTGSGLASWANSTLATLYAWAQKAVAIMKVVGKMTGAMVSDGFNITMDKVGATSASIGNWASDNKGWLIPAGIAGLVVAAGVGIAASGGLGAPVLAPAMLGLLALETGGIVDQEQLVRIGEGNKREAVIPLENSTYMKPFSTAVANDLASILGGMGRRNQQDERPIVYVGNLIGDERSLKELERRLRLVRIQETNRGVNS